eukprot:2830678-Rhodomonas_salina.1
MGGGAGGKTCDNCQQAGHIAAQCPNEAQCHCWCGATFPFFFLCEWSHVRLADAKWLCGRSGSTAHGKADCPNLGKSCDVCGKVRWLGVDVTCWCNCQSWTDSCFPFHAPARDIPERVRCSALLARSTSRY